jgi:hypothetical protein
MHQFKPKMKDGMGKDVGVSPEVHAEWADKEGKHSAEGIKGMGGPGAGTPVIKDNARNFSDSNRGPEAKNVAKQYGSDKGKPAFPSYSGSSGHKTGPQKNAGKGAFEGSTKGQGGAGKLNTGNGGLGDFSGGKKLKGIV